jgi:hypothetical protein
MKITLTEEQFREITDLLWKANKGEDMGWEASRKIKELDKKCDELVAESAKQDREYWRIVDFIGWRKDGEDKGIKCSEYTDSKKRKLMDAFGQVEMSHFSDWVWEKHQALYKPVDAAVEAQSEHYYGDDSFGDLLNEIVGRGKAFYEAVLADPSKAVGMDYRESFSYVIPSEDDYKYRSCHTLYDMLVRRFLGQKKHYDPTLWEGTNQDTDLTAVKAFYDDIVEIIDEEIDTVEAVKTVCEKHDLDKVYAVSYETRHYGLGNFVNEVKNYLL